MFKIDNGILISYLGEESVVTIPPQVHTIGSSAFEWNENIEKVIFHKGVKEICDEAFYSCKRLTTIEGWDNVSIIGSFAFASCNKLRVLSFPSMLTIIGDGAFESTAITHAIFPENLKIIGSDAFAHCRYLNRVIFNNSLCEIKSRAFAFCAVIEEANIPDSVKVLGEYAFKACASLKSAVLGVGIIKLSKGLFEDCGKLIDITIKGRLEEIGERAFSACIALEVFEMQSTVKIIGKHCFRRCQSLRLIKIPNDISDIGENAFSCCYCLKVIFEGSVKKINRFAFPDCETSYPSDIKYMFSSSFINRKEVKLSPNIGVPECVIDFCPSLSIAPEFVAPGNTVLNNPHTVYLKKDKIRLFIGKNYYLNNEKLISNGKLDFDTYDSFWQNADYDEKHYIAALCLCYRENIPENIKKGYLAAIENREDEIAAFAVNINDTKLLKYIINTNTLSDAFLSHLYDIAYEKNRAEIISIINSTSKKVTFFDIFSLEEDYSFWKTRKIDRGLIITEYESDSIAERLPEFIDGQRVISVADSAYSNACPNEIIVPKSLFYPGGKINDAIVTFEYIDSKIYIPTIDDDICLSYVYDGNKYFDFEAFDNVLSNMPISEAFKAMAYRVIYRVNINESLYEVFYKKVSEALSEYKSILTKNEKSLIEKAIKTPAKAMFSAEYEAVKHVPKEGIYKTDDGEFYFDANGILTGVKLCSNKAEIPSLIREIGDFALENITLDSLSLPPTLIKTHANSFNNSAIKAIELGENTYLAPEFFINSDNLEFFVVINSEGEKITLPYPRLNDFKEGIRRNYIFISRLKNKIPTAFDLKSYDSMPLSEENSILRAYYRMSSDFIPKVKWENSIVLSAFIKMAQNDDITSFNKAISNNFWQSSFKDEVIKAAKGNEFLRRIDEL